MHRVSKQFESGGELDRLLARGGLADQPLTTYAVTDVSLDVHRGEILGIVGESGCGKSTLGRIIAGLSAPTTGTVEYALQPVTTTGNTDGRLKIQMVFQDPSASLNPRMWVGEIVSEAPLAHGLVSRHDVATFTDGILARVGLDADCKTRYPHQFSGGQRQRIAIARALAVNPQVLVCDEVVSALDLSIQAQIINLFADLRESLGLTYVFISHDLGVIRYLCDRVAVMYLGRVVELADASKLFANPRHPYTQALLAHTPAIGKRLDAGVPLQGEAASPLQPPGGCAFHPRCGVALPVCSGVRPELSLTAAGHYCACHLVT